MDPQYPRSHSQPLPSRTMKSSSTPKVTKKSNVAGQQRHCTEGTLDMIIMAQDRHLARQLQVPLNRRRETMLGIRAYQRAEQIPFSPATFRPNTTNRSETPPLSQPSRDPSGCLSSLQPVPEYASVNVSGSALSSAKQLSNKLDYRHERLQRLSKREGKGTDMLYPPKRGSIVRGFPGAEVRSRLGEREVARWNRSHLDDGLNRPHGSSAEATSSSARLETTMTGTEATIASLQVNMKPPPQQDNRAPPRKPALLHAVTFKGKPAETVCCTSDPYAVPVNKAAATASASVPTGNARLIMTNTEPSSRPASLQSVEDTDTWSPSLEAVLGIAMGNAIEAINPDSGRRELLASGDAVNNVRTSIVTSLQSTLGKRGLWQMMADKAVEWLVKTDGTTAKRYAQDMAEAIQAEANAHTRRRVRFSLQGIADPHVKDEIDLPPKPPYRDIAIHNNAARAALIHDRGHHVGLSAQQRVQVRALRMRFPWLPGDHRSRVVVGRAYQGRITPEDLMRLCDNRTSPVPRTKYYWGSKMTGPPRFYKVPLTNRELNDRVQTVLSNPARFTVAWNTFTECVAWRYSEGHSALAFYIIGAANWHLNYILKLSREHPWRVALEYHLLVHRKRMSFNHPFVPKEWHFAVDNSALAEALQQQGRPSSST